MKEMRLRNLVDINNLQKIQDSFSNVTGMTVVTVDESGAVTKISNSNEFCSKYNKNSVFGGDRDINLKSGRATTYTLPSGLTEFAAPIIVGDKQVGAIVAGLVATDKMDDVKIAKYAANLNVDERDFGNAIKRAKIVSKSEIDNAVDFLQSMANLIVGSAKKDTVSVKSLNIDLGDGLKEVAVALNNKVNEVDELLEENSLNNKKLYDGIVTLKRLSDDSAKKVGDTKDTVKVIQDIAMNTRILGFNASIEASRAKESGKGFGVIAQEVRSLADVSKSSADKIEDTIQAIGTDSDEISQSVNKTEEAINKNMENSNNILELLKEISALTQQLK